MLAKAVLPAIAALLVASTASAQRVLEVPWQYRTIQAAIDAAQSKDTVRVDGGTYGESLDFKGKAVHVRSRYGALVTVIRGRVQFRSGEAKDSVLEGFTVTNGNPGILIEQSGPTVKYCIIQGNTVYNTFGVGGGGIASGSPVGKPAYILNNLIVNNRAEIRWELFPGMGIAIGGGILCSNAVVAGNVISGNSVYAPQAGMGSCSTYGGGIYASSSVLVNNIVTQNGAETTRGGAGGGGIAAGSCKIINNTVIRNGTNTSPWPYANGGGIAELGVGTNEIVNNIVRGNIANLDPQITAGASVAYCNVEGGYPGTGNTNADPRFTSDGTFHLGPDSPCRDAGSRNHLNFSASDFEWDDRGWGSGVDIGADEFAPHVYHHGETRAGKTFTLTVIGAPGRVAWLGYAASLLQQPIPVPGSGQLWLDPWTLQLMPLGVLPATGQVELKLSIPANAPAWAVPFQALVGLELTRPEVIQVVW